MSAEGGGRGGSKRLMPEEIIGRLCKVEAALADRKRRLIFVVGST